MIDNVAAKYVLDNPSVWNYRAIGAFDVVQGKPATFGKTGVGVGVALISSPYFKRDHPALVASNINIVTVDVKFTRYDKPKAMPFIYMMGDKVMHEEIRTLSIPREISYESENYVATTYECATRHWRPNHLAAIIAGNVDTPVEYFDYRMIDNFRTNNPKILDAYPVAGFPYVYYYGGLAPKANVFAFPRGLEPGERDTALIWSILKDIEQNRGIGVVAIAGKLRVSPEEVALLNAVAERGKIIVHAVGNDAKNLDLTENSPFQSFEFVEGASIHDLSESFWRRHIWVGAMSCFKASDADVGIHLWPGSSYHVNNAPENKNFIVAPGASVLSASYHHYELGSGTGTATAWVAGALALALEGKSANDVDDIVAALLMTRKSFIIDDVERSLSVLNLPTLLGTEQ